ncbi:MAG: SCO family protein [Thermoanaerobaculia bacterium]|jgi:protein SCO1/2
MVRRLALALGFAAALGCGRPEAPKAAAPGAAEKPYPLKGVVVSVDPAASQVIVRHEEIPGYMDAMTMPFKVAETKMLDELKPGDTIEAKLVVGEKASRLEGIVVSRHGTAPSVQTIPEQGPYGAPGDVAPVTVLVGQDGKPLSLANFRGKAVALTFIFTRCPLPEFCPRMNAQFAETESALAKEPALYAKTQLLTVSFDPEHDTPQVLREYRERFLQGVKGVVPAHWKFATGTPANIKEFATFFGLTYLKSGEQFVHSLATAVVTPEGKVFSIRRGNDWEPPALVEDLRKAASGEAPKVASP